MLTNEEGSKYKNCSQSGQRVFVLIKRGKDDPPVPRLEIVDHFQNKDGVDKWTAQTKSVPPTQVDKATALVISMREFVSICDTWIATKYDLNMCVTEYIQSVASGREKAHDWTPPLTDD